MVVLIDVLASKHVEVSIFYSVLVGFMLAVVNNFYRDSVFENYGPLRVLDS